jgi:hypothetical protein
MNFWFHLIDFIFSLFGNSNDNDYAAKWFRDLESKDGQEPKQRLDLDAPPPGFSESTTRTGTLPIKLIR